MVTAGSARGESKLVDSAAPLWWKDEGFNAVLAIDDSFIVKVLKIKRLVYSPPTFYVHQFTFNHNFIIIHHWLTFCRHWRVVFPHCSLSGQAGGAGGAEQGAEAVQPAAVHPADRRPAGTHQLTHRPPGAAGAVRDGTSTAGGRQQQRCDKCCIN